MGLKGKTVNGIIWSFIDTFAGQGIQFIVGIVLARILSPREFGLIGMITIFIAISQSFIDSGFSTALIRKKDCTQHDYSTVFYFNLSIGIIMFFILFFGANAISSLFNEPELKKIIQVLGIVLIINSLTIIQRTILIKNIDFKLQARISVLASIGSGLIGILLALKNFGVWSLVGQQISRQALNSFFLWLWNKWRPLLIFSIKSFKELFGFGSKILISGLINTTFQNVYYLIIGKYFSAIELGYYTWAEQFKNLPSRNLTAIIGRVSFPVLSSFQDDNNQLRANYKKLISVVMFITFILMMGMAAIAKPLVLVLIGEQWIPSIIYLQMLCFVGMLYPLHALNLNILNVKGRSDLFLKLEIIKKVLAVPIIIIGIFLGIKIMIVGIMVNSLIAYYMNSYWSGKLINYSVKEQLKDIVPSFLIALTVSVIVYLFNYFLPFNNLLKLVLGISLGAIVTFTISETLKFDSYLYLKEIVKLKISELRNAKNK